VQDPKFNPLLPVPPKKKKKNPLMGENQVDFLYNCFSLIA
jgi:hypothetical protein